MNQSIKELQWGNTINVGNNLSNGKLNCINSLGRVALNKLSAGASAFSIISKTGLFEGCVLEYNSIINSVIGHLGFIAGMKAQSSTINAALGINSKIDRISIKNGRFNSYIPSNKYISRLLVDGSDIPDISTATIIFGQYYKTIFTRQDETPRLSYYDNTDTLQIVSVDA